MSEELLEVKNLGIHLDSGLGVFDALLASFSMVLGSSLGMEFGIVYLLFTYLALRFFNLMLTNRLEMETLIIAALMAMRHPKSIVLRWLVLLTGLGRIVPNLISRKRTNSAATVLCIFWAAFTLYCLEIRFKSFAQERNGRRICDFAVKYNESKSVLMAYFSQAGLGGLPCNHLGAWILEFSAHVVGGSY